MGKLTAVCLKKPSKSKKHPQEEKKKIEETKSLPQPELTQVEPAAPKSARVHRKKQEPRRDKGIVIVEGAPEARKSPQIAPGDKGKGVLREPSPPPKKQKPNPPSEPVRIPQTEELLRSPITLQNDLYLKGASGPVEVATATATVSRVVNSLNIMGSELWAKLNIDNPNNLLDLGIHASVLVFILTSRFLLSRIIYQHSFANIHHLFRASSVFFATIRQCPSAKRPSRRKLPSGTRLLKFPPLPLPKKPNCMIKLSRSLKTRCLRQSRRPRKRQPGPTRLSGLSKIFRLSPNRLSRVSRETNLAFKRKRRS